MEGKFKMTREEIRHAYRYLHYYCKLRGVSMWVFGEGQSKNNPIKVRSKKR